MLKKAAHIIIAIYLMTTIVGFTITQHHCGDSMQYTHIDNVDECGCNNACGMCEIETKYVHLGVNFIINKTPEFNFIPDFSIISYIETLVSSTSFTILPNLFFDSSPPILDIGTRLALNQSFLC